MRISISEHIKKTMKINWKILAYILTILLIISIAINISYATKEPNTENQKFNECVKTLDECINKWQDTIDDCKWNQLK